MLPGSPPCLLLLVAPPSQVVDRTILVLQNVVLLIFLGVLLCERCCRLTLAHVAAAPACCPAPCCRRCVGGRYGVTWLVCVGWLGLRRSLQLACWA